MSITSSEIAVLTHRVESAHPPTALALACLVHLSSDHILARDPVRQSRLMPIHDLGMACVQTYAEKHGIPWCEVKDAIRALRDAGVTAGYLHTIPD